MTVVDMNAETKPGYRGNYMERGGESALLLVEKLIAEPEFDLTTEQKAEVYSFEHSLNGFEIVEGETLSDIVRNHKAEDLTAPLVFPHAYLNKDAGKEFEKYDILAPKFDSAELVYEWFAEQASRQSMPPNTLRALAKYGIDWFVAAQKQALLDGHVLDSELVEVKSVVVDPVRAIELTAQIMRARGKLLEMRDVYKEGGLDVVDGAKRAVADVYLGRINSLVSQDIALMTYVYDQAEAAGDSGLMMAATAVVPPAFRPMFGNEEREDRVLQSLDYLQNGMGLDQYGKSSPISEKLLHQPERSEAVTVESVFTPEQIEILKNTMMSPETMKIVMTSVIAKAGLLSAEDPSSWTVERKGRAGDNLFQVVIHPTKNTFQVDGISGADFVPSAPRSLYDVLVIGGCHELPHMDQVRADDTLGETLSIASLKGRRVSAIREMGANIKQRAAEIKFFGYSKPAGTLTYARAIQVLRDGGSVSDAAEAFYDEKMETFPQMGRDSAAAEAANRVLRLLQQRKHNTQWLSYAEESIFLQEMQDTPKTEQDRVGVITALDLVDQVRLHKYGLLPELSSETIDWTDLIYNELKPYIEKVLAGEPTEESKLPK